MKDEFTQEIQLRCSFYTDYAFILTILFHLYLLYLN